MASFHQIALRVGSTAVLVGCTANSSLVPDSWDGLEYRAGEASGALYVSPGAESKAYRTVMIDPLVVDIDRNWNPVVSTIPIGQGIAPGHMSSSEIQHIKDTIASEFRKIFVDELTVSGYQVMDRPCGDTVRVSPGLADVYMDTPDRSLAASLRADRMTLVMDLRDAMTGQLFARLIDRQTGAMGVLQFPNSVTNNAEFRRAVQAWAQRLRAGLDEMSMQPP